MGGLWTIVVSLFGALCFGLVMGWITYRTLRFSKTGGLADLATVLGIIGGAAVTNLFPVASGLFGAYCIGLALGFFGYLRSARDPEAPSWMGGPARNGDGAAAEHDRTVSGAGARRTLEGFPP
jgi:NhaP-type Na+/H+ or K+/H+ antiporter